MFSRILIANRGEIACRIIATCQRLGVDTVAVYSDADVNARHVAMASYAMRLGPAAAATSYLNADAIVAAAVESGAEAIHPGYGFLSERVELIDKAAAAGIAFIGPHRDAIARMGSKAESKRIAREAGVACVPGFDGATQDEKTLINEAHAIGLPLLIKASAGGGGKGMRLVTDMSLLPGLLRLARAEAEASFGDGRLLLERYIRRPRHVEVQLLGDQQGNLVHLFERECSVQRNYQKLIEEAPANHLSDDVRAELFAAATSLGRAIGYDSAGTVEFVLDADDRNRPYFLEVNTRLQVEHPVTELTTGLDLVEWQLRVASGEPLTFSQSDISRHGWAIEARVNAEQPEEGFAASFGRIERYYEPLDLSGVRIDSGLKIGSEVPPYYDSMVAKVIGHGPSRRAAKKALIRGLGELRIEGVQTIQPLLRDLLNAQAFDGVLTTAFLTELYPAGWSREPALKLEARLAAAAAWFADRLPERHNPIDSLAGFRLTEPAGLCAHYSLIATDADGSYDIGLVIDPKGELVCQLGGERMTFRVEPGGRLIANGNRVYQTSVSNDQVTLWSDGDYRRLTVEPEVNRPAPATSDAAAGIMRAELPGLVSSVLVAIGDSVIVDQPLIVLEAMKLFHTLVARTPGEVIMLPVSVGDTVGKGDILIDIRARSASSEDIER